MENQKVACSCYKCDERHENCHATCEKYKSYKKKLMYIKRIKIDYELRK